MSRTYNAGVSMMAFGPIGKLFAAASMKARKYLGSVFEKYYATGHHGDASGLIQQRSEWYLSRGFPLRDLANLEAGHSIAMLANTVPTAFWFIFHIFSDPVILLACRQELLDQIAESMDNCGTRIRTLDISSLQSSCPILLSTFKETMRFYNIGINIRQVLHDHLLDNKYLLRAGATIFMPSTVQHFSPAIWGADASRFKYDRFADRARPHVPAVSYRAFGGGATLCPGRHFATTEILTLSAMLVLRFDVRSVEGAWVIPSTRKAGMTSVMPAPDYDVQVKIERREEDAGVRWEWVVVGSANLGVDEVQCAPSMAACRV
jgi:hypothetical protein